MHVYQSRNEITTVTVTKGFREFGAEGGQAVLKNQNNVMKKVPLSPFKDSPVSKKSYSPLLNVHQRKENRKNEN